MGTKLKLAVVRAAGEDPVFQAGDHVVISSLFPVGHYSLDISAGSTA